MPLALTLNPAKWQGALIVTVAGGLTVAAILDAFSRLRHRHPLVAEAAGVRTRGDAVALFATALQQATATVEDAVRSLREPLFEDIVNPTLAEHQREELNRANDNVGAARDLLPDARLAGSRRLISRGEAAIDRLRAGLDHLQRYAFQPDYGDAWRMDEFDEAEAALADAQRATGDVVEAVRRRRR